MELNFIFWEFSFKNAKMVTGEIFLDITRKYPLRGYILGSGAMYLCIKIFTFNYSKVSNKHTGPNT